MSMLYMVVWRWSHSGSLRKLAGFTLLEMVPCLTLRYKCHLFEWQLAGVPVHRKVLKFWNR